MPFSTHFEPFNLEWVHKLLTPDALVVVHKVEPVHGMCWLNAKLLNLRVEVSPLQRKPEGAIGVN